MKKAIYIFILISVACKQETSYLDANHTKSGSVHIVEENNKDFKTAENQIKFNKANFNYKNENYTLSLKMFKELQLLEPNNYILLNSIALNYCKLKYYDKADSLFQVIITNFSGKPSGIINYSTCFMNQEKYTESIDTLEFEINKYYSDSSNFSTNDKHYYSIIKTNMAISYKSLKDSLQAKKNAQIGLKYAMDSTIVDVLHSIVDEMNNSD